MLWVRRGRAPGCAGHGGAQDSYFVLAVLARGVVVGANVEAVPAGIVAGESAGNLLLVLDRPGAGR